MNFKYPDLQDLYNALIGLAGKSSQEALFDSAIVDGLYISDLISFKASTDRLISKSFMMS